MKFLTPPPPFTGYVCDPLILNLNNIEKDENYVLNLHPQRTWFLIIFSDYINIEQRKKLNEHTQPL